MTTVMLWCIVNGKKARAAAPTGIAASNIEIEGTGVSATTLHAMFDFDTELQTKLDFSKSANKKIKGLLELEVLFLDECSMIDVDAWLAQFQRDALRYPILLVLAGSRLGETLRDLRRQSVCACNELRATF